MLVPRARVDDEYLKSMIYPASGRIGRWLLHCDSMAGKKKAPPPSEKSTKDDVIRMRVTSEQKAAIMAAAERDGLGLSPVVAAVGLRGPAGVEAEVIPLRGHLLYGLTSRSFCDPCS